MSNSVGFFKALSVISLLASDLTEANQDAVIDVKEQLKIMGDVLKSLNLKSDIQGIEFTEELITNVFNAVNDKAITETQWNLIGSFVCSKLGVSFKKE